MSSYIEDALIVARSHGGDCLSEKCDKYNENLLWKCRVGHEWVARFGSVKSGQWCRKCFADIRRKNSSQVLAENNNGKCLNSDKYTNTSTVLDWACKEGHTWKAAYTNIMKEKWCPFCAKNARLTIDKMQILAKQNGGECLSDRYTNNNTKLSWKCGVGHLWEAMPANIIKGSWCPFCSSSIGERACAEILRQLTGNEFIKIRPKWLEGLEIDAYCEALNLAVEYNGQYHYEKVFNFMDDDHLAGVIARDAKKKKLCEERGVVFVVIDEARTFNIDNLAIRIKEKLVEKKISFNDCCIDKSKIYNNQLKKYVDIITAKGGECLDGYYLSSRTKISVRCNNGHTWMVTPNGIKNGHWCPVCAGKTTVTIDDVKKIASDRGGECLSDMYKNSHSILAWKCNAGHVWNASFTSIKHNKSWCPECARRRKK